MPAPMRQFLAGVRPSDVMIGVGLLAIGLADALSTSDYRGGTIRLCVAVVLQTLPLAIRRRHTVLAVSLSLLGVAVEVAGVRPYGGVYGLVGFLVLVHAVARWTSGKQLRTGVALLVGGATVRFLSQSPDGPLGLLGNVFLVVVFATAAWGVGRMTRGVSAKESLWAARHAEIVAMERARISRDLHDVVGHALAGISLTAGAAEQQPGARDPDMAAALSLIRTMSRDAASDVRRLVGLIREEGDSIPDTTPQPTIESIPAMVQGAREAGLTVEYEQNGRPHVVSGGLSVAAHRVVQEGLTNVAKHGTDARARVRLTWAPGRLEVEVRNAAHAYAGGQVSDGHGLVGLRERVLLYDGTLTAGPGSGGEFRLHAEFRTS